MLDYYDVDLLGEEPPNHLCCTNTTSAALHTDPQAVREGGYGRARADKADRGEVAEERRGSGWEVLAYTSSGEALLDIEVR